MTEMVVTGPWTKEAAEAVWGGRVDRLVLNYALGFGETSLAFLEGMPLRELVVIDRRLTDLTPIYSLGSTLRGLSVVTNPGLRIDLDRLPALRRLSAAWTQVSATIDAAVGIEIAHLRSYGPRDFLPLRSLTQLAELVLKDRPRLTSLGGLSAFPGLRLLGIYLASGLTDIAELEGRSEIEDLALQGCRRITRLDALTGCVGLRKLNVSECGDLASLDPIRNLDYLEQVSMFGSTKVVDDDLAPLAALPRLEELRMQSRRSYRPSVEEIQAAIERR
ncbi:hypothetical protein [Homoserinibacter sp. GY 40078]|uniref:hypothetical protein n=1 Tax=Homoserinibacter sp. GY 40078 TaxID=2603275 RepID=UPI0011CC777C|nr:hypothetical protein [Homoserinibacter sp. GY 40078]TXK17718.1 hypothetical protein FVQ89_13030 [Homoserinibacter sp. GY 40078]